MCTVIKVKRKITDDPADCLILECKKRRKHFSDKIEPANLKTLKETKENEESTLESIKQILKYAGSAKNDVIELLDKTLEFTI